MQSVFLYTNINKLAVTYRIVRRHYSMYTHIKCLRAVDHFFISATSRALSTSPSDVLSTLDKPRYLWLLRTSKKETSTDSKIIIKIFRLNEGSLCLLKMK